MRCPQWNDNNFNTPHLRTKSYIYKVSILSGEVVLIATLFDKTKAREMPRNSLVMENQREVKQIWDLNFVQDLCLTLTILASLSI